MVDINPDVVPSTIEAAVQAIVAGTDEAEKEYIRKIASSASAAHHGLGRALRNGWSLWQDDSPLKRDAVKTYGIAHADDISGLILSWAVAIIRGDEFDPQAECQRYHEHWKKYGTTALKAGGWQE